MPKKTTIGHAVGKSSGAKNFCFGCGKDNPDGMKLKFVLDEENQKVRCKFRLPIRFTGPPRHVHGGVIATLLDEAMSKVNRLRHVVAMTSEMTVNYLKMVPLEKWCFIEGWEERVEGREHYNVAEIRNAEGVVLARGRGKFIAIDPERKFGKAVKKPQKSSKS